MNITELRQQMYDAMKNKDKIRKDVLSAIINTATNAAIAENSKDNVTDAMVDNAIRKELKTITEQIETCPDNRTDKLTEFNAKKDVVLTLMPKQMNKDEIIQYLNDNFADLIATKNKGAIMKEIMPVLKGKADGKLINSVITELLNN